MVYHLAKKTAGGPAYFRQHDQSTCIIRITVGNTKSIYGPTHKKAATLPKKPKFSLIFASGGR
jgi:hypothetical protein